MNGFTSRTEAVYRQIVEPLQSDPDIKLDHSGERTLEDQVRDLYDVDAIADAVIGDYDEGYLVKPEFGGLTDEMVEAGESNDAGVEAFWDVVRDNAR